MWRLMARNPQRIIIRADMQVSTSEALFRDYNIVFDSYTADARECTRPARL